jgi:poly(A) polymerase
MAALARIEPQPDALRRLVALLPDAAAVESVGARLKLSNQQRKRIASAAEPIGTARPHELGYRLGVAGAIDRLLLAGEPIDTLGAWAPPTLPVTGGALVQMGLRKGPLVAATLRRIEDRWIAAGFPQEIDAIVADEVAQALRSTSSR